jgi:hypothetical protein
MVFVLLLFGLYFVFSLVSVYLVQTNGADIGCIL